MHLWEANKSRRLPSKCVQSELLGMSSGIQRLTDYRPANSTSAIHTYSTITRALIH